MTIVPFDEMQNVKAIKYFWPGLIYMEDGVITRVIGFESELGQNYSTISDISIESIEIKKYVCHCIRLWLQHNVKV